LHTLGGKIGPDIILPGQVFNSENLRIRFNSQVFQITNIQRRFGEDLAFSLFEFIFSKPFNIVTINYCYMFKVGNDQVILYFPA